eukprot:SAG31_NODE_22181_length_532_cov_0.709007_1_plen_41_part_01
MRVYFLARFDFLAGLHTYICVGPRGILELNYILPISYTLAI